VNDASKVKDIQVQIVTEFKHKYFNGYIITVILRCPKIIYICRLNST